MAFVLSTIMQKIGETSEQWEDEKQLEELKDEAHTELAKALSSEQIGFFFENKIALPVEYLYLYLYLYLYISISIYIYIYSIWIQSSESEHELTAGFKQIQLDPDHEKFFEARELYTNRRRQYDKLKIQKKYNKDKILHINFRVGNIYSQHYRWKGMKPYLGCLLNYVHKDQLSLHLATLRTQS